MSVLIDTNVLLRRTQPGHQLYGQAVASVERLPVAGEDVYYTLQNIAEFWNVLTRPRASNGLGASTDIARAEVEKIEAALQLLRRLPTLMSNGSGWCFGMASSGSRFMMRAWWRR